MRLQALVQWSWSVDSKFYSADCTGPSTSYTAHDACRTDRFTDDICNGINIESILKHVDVCNTPHNASSMVASPQQRHHQLISQAMQQMNQRCQQVLSNFITKFFPSSSTNFISQAYHQLSHISHRQVLTLMPNQLHHVVFNAHT
eukprot:839433_1